MDKKANVEMLANGRLKSFNYPIANDSMLTVKQMLNFVNKNGMLFFIISTPNKTMGVEIEHSFTNGHIQIKQLVNNVGLLKIKNYNYYGVIDYANRKLYTDIKMISYGAISYFLYFKSCPQIDSQTVLKRITDIKSQSTGNEWVDWILKTIETLNCSIIGVTDDDCSIIEFIGNPSDVEDMVFEINSVLN